LATDLEAANVKMATYNPVSNAATYFADNNDKENNFSNSWREHSSIVYLNAATKGLSAEHIVRHTANQQMILW